MLVLQGGEILRCAQDDTLKSFSPIMAPFLIPVALDDRTARDGPNMERKEP